MSLQPFAPLAVPPSGAAGGALAGTYPSPSIASPVTQSLSFTGTETFNGSANFNLGVDVTSVGQGLKVAEGSNAKQGTAVLAAGQAVVANTSVTASSRIILTTNATGGAAGFLVVSARTPGTSFTILSSSGTDTSTVAYEIFEPG
jgi:hypothetical protein